MALFTPLYLWRILLPMSEWAFLAFIPLAAMMFTGLWPHYMAIARAMLRPVVKQQSWMSKFLTGRISSIARSLAFLIISIPILAGQISIISHSEILIMMAISIMSSTVFVYLQPRLSTHFHPQFATAISASLGTWFVALICIPAFALISWEYLDPWEPLQYSLGEWLTISGNKKLPPHEGWVANTLWYVYSYEGFKLWIVSELQSIKGSFPVFVSIAFCIDSALVGLVYARSSISLSLFIQGIHKRDQIQNEKIETDSENIVSRQPSHENNLWYFLIALIAIIIITVMAITIGEVRRPEPYVMPKRTLQLSLELASKAPSEELNSGDIANHLEKNVYGDLREEVSRFAEHHYNLIDFETAIQDRARIDLFETVEKQLYNRFEPRFIVALDKLDDSFAESYSTALNKSIQELTPEKKRKSPRSKFTKNVLIVAKSKIERTYSLTSSEAEIRSKIDIEELSLSLVQDLSKHIKNSALSKGVDLGSGYFVVGQYGKVKVCPSGTSLCRIKGNLDLNHINVFMSRDEFEAVLNNSINAQKTEWIGNILDALNKKSTIVHDSSGGIVDEAMAKSEELASIANSKKRLTERGGFWFWRRALSWFVFWSNPDISEVRTAE